MTQPGSDATAANATPPPGAGKKDRSATPATRMLGQEGVPFALHAYRHDPAVTDFGAEAAEALGVDPRRVFKTLVAEVDGSMVVAVVPVSGLLDLKALAAAMGGKRATMADPAAAERVTGYRVGGISPLGQRRRLACVIDDSCLQHPSVLVSAGRRGLDIEVQPGKLIDVLNARLAPIGRA